MKSDFLVSPRRSKKARTSIFWYIILSKDFGWKINGIRLRLRSEYLFVSVTREWLYPVALCRMKTTSLRNPLVCVLPLYSVMNHTRWRVWNRGDGFSLFHQNMTSLTTFIPFMLIWFVFIFLRFERTFDSSLLGSSCQPKRMIGQTQTRKSCRM